MALGSFDTYELVKKIEEKKAPAPYYLKKYFGSIMEFDSEEVHFDYVLGERKMAPFVSPLHEGKVMKNLGSTMRSYRPAYVKPKHIVRPTEVTKRRAGEAFGGSMSLQQRMQLQILENFRLEREAIDNRLEWMVVELLKNGSVTVSGEDYPEQVVDFGRDAGLSITLTTTARWNDSAPDPIGDLESLATLMSKADHGAPGREVYMDPDAWESFRTFITADANRAALLDTNLSNQFVDADRGPMVHDDNVQAVGSLSGRFNLFVDSRDYTNDAGSVVPYLASGELIMVNPSVQGVQAYGAILDDDVMRPMAAYPKTWVQEDPSVRMTMTQSAPLPIAERINATGYIKVQ